MRFQRIRTPATTATGLLLACAMVGVTASPMTVDTSVEASVPNFALEHLSPEATAALAELRPDVRRDVEHLELPTALSAGLSSRPESQQRNSGVRRQGSPAGHTSNSVPVDLTGADSHSSAIDAFRGLVNVTPRAGGSGDAAQSRVRGEPDNAAPAFEAGDWARDALKGVVSAILQPDINERGEVTFSLLGFGELSLILSGDRGVVSLTQGDNVLLVARRQEEGMQATGNQDRASAEFFNGVRSSSGAGSAPTGSTPADGENPLRQIIELVEDVVSHPIFVLALLIVVGYVILLQVLKHRAVSRRRRHRRRTREHDRGSSMPAPIIQRKERRSRHRHKRRRSQPDNPSTQRA